MIIDGKLASRIIQPRPRDSHKGNFGRALLIGGLYPYGGAIIMAALATVNSGAGLVMVATDRENIAPLHAHLPEAMAFEVTDTECLSEQIAMADVVLIGSGLGEDRLAQELLDLVLDQIRGWQTLLIDGSALNLLAQKAIVNWQTERVVLTPHQKEWERLSGLSMAKQTDASTREALLHFPRETVLVAKSSQTRLYDQEGRFGVLSVGGSYQATGGMGDTLAGMIAGFVPQFKSAPLFDRVAVASYLHSKIAQDLSKKAYVVLPTKISEEIPKVMEKLSRQDQED